MATGWDPSSVLNSAAISGTGNILMSCDGSNGGVAYSITGHATGKWYAEMTIAGPVFVNPTPILGITSTNANTFGFPGQQGDPSDSVGNFSGNLEETYVNAVQQQFGLSSAALVSGETMSIAIDADNHLIYFLAPGLIANFGANGWNGLSTANPAAQVGGIAYSLTTDARLIAFFGSGGSGTMTATLNTGQSAFLRTPPVGFSAWDLWGTQQSGQAFLSGAGSVLARASIRLQGRATLAAVASMGFSSLGQLQQASGSFNGRGGMSYLRQPAILVSAPSSSDFGSGILASFTASLVGLGVSQDFGLGVLSLPGIASNTQFLSNLLVDSMLRGQALAPPVTWYIALVTSLGSQSSPGTEVTGAGYARQAISTSLVNWSGTQGPSTTTPSIGTTGQSSNNVAINFGAPAADWGTVIGYEFWDAPSAGGNRWLAGKLTAPLTISNGGPARSFGIGALTVAIA